MNDLDSIQGTWYLASLESGGETMGADALAGATIVVKGRRFESKGMGGTYAGTVVLDSTKTPKALDLVFTKGHATGTRNVGIYKLAGGKWTLCLATRGDRRPRMFATKAGFGIVLETFRREPLAAPTGARSSRPKGAVTMPAAAVPRIEGSGPPTAWEGEWAMVNAVLNGAALAPGMVEWCRRVTRGDITAVLAGPQVMLKARFSLNSSVTPATVEYLNLAGAQKGRKQRGIYKLDGDLLSVCMAAPGQPAPREFSSTGRDGRSCTTWRLIKPAR